MEQWTKVEVEDGFTGVAKGLEMARAFARKH